MHGECLQKYHYPIRALRLRPLSKVQMNSSYSALVSCKKKKKRVCVESLSCFRQEPSTSFSCSWVSVEMN